MSSAYCDQDDIENRFGVENVDTWATLASTDTSVEKTARINEAIAVVSDEFDEILRCVTPYESKLPISTVPDSVKDKVAIGVGLWLRSFHNADDHPESYIANLEKRYKEWISEVRNGTRKLYIP